MKTIRIVDRGAISFVKLTANKKRNKAALALLFVDIENFIESDFTEKDTPDQFTLILTVARPGDAGPGQH